MLPRRKMLVGGSLATALIALGIVGAALGALSRAGLVSVPALVPRAMFAVALLAGVVLVAVLAHIIRRADLTRRERLVLALAVMALPPAAFVYLALDPERTRGFARRVLLLFEPLRVSGGAA